MSTTRPLPRRLPSSLLGSSAIPLAGLALALGTTTLACGTVILEESSGSSGAGGAPSTSTGGTSTGGTSTGGTSTGGTSTSTSPCPGAPCPPEVLASDLYYANRLALDPQQIYWTSADGSLRALPLAGGTPTTFAGGQNDPWDIAVDAAGTYWTNSGSDTVQSLPSGAPFPQLLANAGNPLGLTVHQGALYYTDTYDKLSDQEHVVRVQLPGGAPQIVASTPGAWMVAADDTQIYWTDQATDAVWTAPSLGGTPTQLASLLDPADIEVDTDAVYVTALEGTYRIPLSGGAPTVLVAGAGRGLAIDATHVFVGTADGRLLRVPKSGGPAIALSKTDLYPSDIGVSDTHVYWLTRSEQGALLRTPK